METTFTIPERVTIIGDWVFASNYGLRTIIIHSGILDIGSYSFYNAWNLTSINYSGTVGQWQSIYEFIEYYEPYYTIYCTDGEIAKDGTVTYYN